MRKTLVAVAGVLLSVSMLGYAGQRGGAPAGGNQPAAPSGGKGTNTNPNPQPSPQPTPVPNQPDNTQPRPTTPIFLTGRVKLLDGKPVPPNVSVRVNCGTNIDSFSEFTTSSTNERPTAFADSNGNFSLMLNLASDSGLLFGCGVRATLG